MNKLKLYSILTLFACGLLFQSCQKEQLNLEEEKNIQQHATTDALCQLDNTFNVYQSNFDGHMTEWFGPDDFYTHTSGKPRLSTNPIHVGDGGTIENYVDCGPLQPYNSCCSSVTVFLDPFDVSGSGAGYSLNSWAQFELWNPLFHSDFQDNIFDVEEKLMFIERVENYAQSLSIPCNGGFLIPSEYNFAWYNSDGKTRVVGVQVIYSPVCFSFGPPSLP